MFGSEWVQEENAHKKISPSLLDPTTREQSDENERATSAWLWLTSAMTVCDVRSYKCIVE